MSGSENTETNAILASGLAIVGLLGVAGAMLPTEMLSWGGAAESEGAGLAPEAVIEQPAETIQAAPDAGQTRQDSAPVFKPVELKSISDADPVPEPGATTAEVATDAPVQPAGAIVSRTPNAPVQELKAVDQAQIPASSAQQVVEDQPVSVPGVTSVATVPTVDPAEPVATRTQEKSAQAGPQTLAESQDMNPVQRDNPARALWEEKGFQPPPMPQPYVAPQPYQPLFPPQYYGYPQWSTPQR